MSNLLRTASAYVPISLTKAVVAGVLQLGTEPRIDRFKAAILFADISGFTPLTEAIGQKGGSEGPEELTRLLNRYFSWMIAFAEAQGGDVVKFGGDALTVIFPAIDEPLDRATRRAVQAAESMQSAMEEFGILESSVGLVTLKMKYGIGAGEVTMACVGGVGDRWEYLVAGDPLRQTVLAERRAQQGEIILSPEAKTIVVSELLPSRPITRPDLELVPNPQTVQQTLRRFIPRPVRTWLDQGLHEWLATLRPMSVLFMGIYQLDYRQPSAISKLHHFLRDLQVIIYQYGGSIPRITVDDKGTVLLILFGAPPESHEDDPERAVRCALDAQRLAQQHRLQTSAGITTGRVFAGPVGGDARREYTVMGDAVNLAARLMVLAGPGQICCNSETYRSAKDQIRFEQLPATQVKGKTDLIAIFRPFGEYPPYEHLSRLQLRETNEVLIGRQALLAQLKENFKEVKNGQPRIVVIEGEVGIGKSRLVRHAVQDAQQLGLTAVLGLGRSIEQNTPYRAWRDIFSAFFGLRENNGAALHIKMRLQQIAPELLERVPLLNDVYPNTFLENNHTAALSPEEREDELIALLLTLLRLWAKEAFLILVLENAHWLDPHSWKIAVRLAAAFVQNQTPILFMLVMRPLEGIAERTEAVLLEALTETRYLRLGPLTVDDTLAAATAKLGLTPHELPEAVANLIRHRAGGNPFFAEEIFYALHDNGYITFKVVQGRVRCLVNDDLDQAAQTLPTTIQNTVLSRIDGLPPTKQLILRVAAVIGQNFTYNILSDTITKHLDINKELIKVYLHDLVHLGLIQMGGEEPNLVYHFRHAIIREVTYQSTLFDGRRRLHRSVAEWYEQAYHNNFGELFLPNQLEVGQSLAVAPHLSPKNSPLGPYHLLLVYHWHQAGDEVRECHYATLVGEQAAAGYANAEAINYLSQALDLMPDGQTAKRVNLLLTRLSIYHRLGDRAHQALDLAQLTNLARQKNDPQLDATISLRQAEYAEATSNYTRALTMAQMSLTQARQLNNRATETSAYILRSKVFLNKGDYQAARVEAQYALDLAEADEHNLNCARSLRVLAQICCQTGDLLAAQSYGQPALAAARAYRHLPTEGDVLNVLGLRSYYLGAYADATHHFEEASYIYHTVGDQRGELQIMYHLGLVHLAQMAYAAARDYFEQVIDLARQIGDRFIEACALSSLGLTYCRLGDYLSARSYLGQAPRIHEEIGSRFGEADSLSKLGIAYYYQTDYQTTKRYFERALQIQREAGSRLDELLSLLYFAHAQTELGDLTSAAEAYHQAQTIGETSGQCLIDISAGLANIALHQGELNQAMRYIEHILASLEQEWAMQIDNLSWVYYISYQVLLAQTATQPEQTLRAEAVLSTAYAVMHSLAAQLQDKKQARSFLQNIQWHQRILAAWRQQVNKPAAQLNGVAKVPSTIRYRRMTRDQLLGLVQATRHNGEMINLVGVDLAGQDLSGIDLRLAYLNGVDLSKANITGANLSQAYLREVNLEGARLDRANLNKANLFRASLVGADLSETNLNRTNLRGADLRGAKLNRANLRGGTLFRANLREADLSEAALIGVNTSGADFFRANLRDANITSEQLSVACSFEQAIMPDGTRRE
jgi:uncharacterized protein YjbI with pentapeptide repeats/class 3 adenylate cyclase/predicted ATPase